MTGREFIFSKKWSTRMFRHFVFWSCCWLYGSLTYYFVQEPFIVSKTIVSPGAFVLLKTLMLTFAYTIPCYTFMYIMLPAFVYGKWAQAVAILLPLLCLMYGMGWWMYWKLFPLIDSLFGLPGKVQYFTKFWPAVVLGLVEPLKIIALAATITYAKHWWIRREEKEKLEQEKLSAELQLLKAQISPTFLFSSLDNIYELALHKSPQTPELLMKLSDLLSYMLYECEATFVPLENEIARMKDFMELEKLRLNDRVETALNVSGNLNELKIAPFLLLPFIEFSFRHAIKTVEQAWINIDIDVNDELIIMKIAMSVGSSEEDKKAIQSGDLTNVQKRLNLLYPQCHKLKISYEPEMFKVLLKIRTTIELQKIMEDNQLNLLA